MSSPPDDAARGRRARPRLRRWRWAAALVAALAIARGALPVALARLIEWQGRLALGRAVEVQDVGLSLLAGQVTLRELRIGAALDAAAPGAPIDPQTALARWPRVFADLAWLRLAAGELRLERLELTGTRVRLARGPDGRVAPLRPRPSGAPPGPVAADDERRGETSAGWPVRLDRLVLSDQSLLIVDEADPAHPPLELTLDELTIAHLALLPDEISVGPVGIRGPRFRVRRDLQLAAPATPAERAPDARAEETGTPAAPAGVPRRYRAADVSVEDANLVLVLDEGELDVRLTLRVHEPSLEPGARFPVELRLEREGGWLELEGQAGLAPPAFAGSLRWKDFPAVRLLEAARPGLPIQVESGSVSGNVEVALVPGEGGSDAPGQVAVRGRIAASDLRAALRNGDLRAVAPGVELVVDEIALPLGAPGAARVALGSLRIREPELHVVRRAGPPRGEEPAAGEPGASQPARISLGALELTGGTLEVRDEGVTPARVLLFREVQVTGADLRWPERDGRLDLALRGLTGLSLEASGALRQGDGTTRVALRKVQLPSLNPYVEEAAGWRFSGGSAWLDATIESKGRRHELDADVELQDLGVDDAQAGAFARTFGMSADLAIALLAGPGGRIRLPVDVTLDEGGADAALTKLLVGAVSQALRGVLAAPVTGLGLALRLLPGERGAELDPVALAPGSDALSPPALQHVTQVAKALDGWPDLALELRGRVGEQDEPLLRARALFEALQSGAAGPPGEAGLLQRRRLVAALERVARGEAAQLEGEDAALLERWIGEAELPREERERLAANRASAVRAALEREGAEAARIRVGETEEGPPGVALVLFPKGD